MHLKWNKFECLTSKFYDENLADKDTDYDSDEEIIVKELCENVNFLFLQLTAVQEVEHLQKYKHIEEKRKMLTVFVTPLSKFDISYICKIFNTENFVSFEQDNCENKALVDSIENNDSPHLCCDNVFFSGIGHSFQELV